MSHPDPMNDPENERTDDDLLRMEDDARRYEDEQAVRAESFATYWAGREQDMRDQKEFWRKWDARWNKGESK